MIWSTAMPAVAGAVKNDTVVTVQFVLKGWTEGDALSPGTLDDMKFSINQRLKANHETSADSWNTFVGDYLRTDATVVSIENYVPPVRYYVDGPDIDNDYVVRDSQNNNHTACSYIKSQRKAQVVADALNGLVEALGDEEPFDGTYVNL